MLSGDQGQCAINLHVFGPNDKVKEHVAEMIQMAAACFTSGGGSPYVTGPQRPEIHSVDMYLLSKSATAARKGCDAACVSGPLVAMCPSTTSVGSVGSGVGTTSAPCVACASHSCGSGCVVTERRCAVMVCDPVHEAADGTAVHDTADIDADPTATAQDRARLAMDIALLQVGVGDRHGTPHDATACAGVPEARFGVE